ncbi:MAG: zinc-dependent metalloprotease, partial [Balneolaceae bacterium]|nr:zinc-dependent metalloprotease [Balneolaceae bacterium]
ETNSQMLEMALNRIRQLSAHEIGHTLGIAHNFAASVNDLASVMDYPHPRATLNDDGTLNLENAYGNSIGEWDKRTVIWGYQDFPEGTNEEEALDDIIEETVDMGLLYISDEAARPPSGLHPYAHLWDYGSDPVSQLDLIMDIRSAALNQFGVRNIQHGRMLAQLEDVLVPIYLYHRYQTEATVKLVGGLDYSYKQRGDNQDGPEIVDADRQTAALDALLRTLDPDELMLSESILDLIPPRPMGISSTRENFRGYTSPALDPVAMAEAAAEHTASLIFNPNRAARLTLQAARNSDYPGFETVLRIVADATLLAEPTDGYAGSIQRAIDTAVLRNMIQLAANNDNAPDVASQIHHYLSELKEDLSEKTESIDHRIWHGHYLRGISMIERFQEDPGSVSVPPSPYIPPGSPIGSGQLQTGSLQSLLQCSF